jgi:tRNA nucleotidyltransferase (CCA-adding enzyme)
MQTSDAIKPLIMKIYTVGGAVRDGLLGLPVQDRDYVVVGASPQDMLRRGFTPVGKDFPVFLHPQTHEEYALARTERKTAPGYTGFVFHADSDVTLEQDLLRRDLTINAIAQAEDGSLIDPFNGQGDLQAKIFRHVSAAFAEDPVRILRVARFAARFHDFSVAPQTNQLMRQMVDAGEVDALVPERVWQEIARGLMEAKPSRMLDVLRACGALARIAPELDALWGRTQHAQIDSGAQAMLAIDIAASDNLSLPIRFAALMQNLGRQEAPPASPAVTAARSSALVEQVCGRLKIPNDCRDLARMTAREQDHVCCASMLDANSLLELFERCDAFRKPQRFGDMLSAIMCNQRACAGRGDTPFLQGAYLQKLLTAARQVDAGKVAQRHAQEPQKIAASVHAERAAAVAAAMQAQPMAPP